MHPVFPPVSVSSQVHPGPYSITQVLTLSLILKSHHLVMIVFSDISTDYRFGTRASGTSNVPSWFFSDSVTSGSYL